MSEVNKFRQIGDQCQLLGIPFSESEAAALSCRLNMSEEEIAKLCSVFDYLADKKNQSIVSTCLKLSRLPLKEPKTFEGFDFSRLHGKDIEKLKNIDTLSPLYEQKNLAFIGPQGIGKTHLAMAFGRKCCEKGIKAYFLKATELEQRLTAARKNDRIGALTNGLVKPSCLIIDEIGRCSFDRENTRIFFDIVDRRSNKEGPNCMIFTSNKTPDTWGEYFDETDSLLCALDRIFYNARVFMMKGESYRGRKLETIAIEAGGTSKLLGIKN